VLKRVAYYVEYPLDPEHWPVDWEMIEVPHVYSKQPVQLYRTRAPSYQPLVFHTAPQPLEPSTKFNYRVMYKESFLFWGPVDSFEEALLKFEKVLTIP
jgi:hypothetical protein